MTAVKDLREIDASAWRVLTCHDKAEAVSCHMIDFYYSDPAARTEGNCRQEIGGLDLYCYDVIIHAKGVLGLLVWVPKPRAIGGTEAAAYAAGAPARLRSVGGLQRGMNKPMDFQLERLAVRSIMSLV